MIFSMANLSGVPNWPLCLRKETWKLGKKGEEGSEGRSTRNGTRGLEGTFTTVVAYCENSVQKTACWHSDCCTKFNFGRMGLRPGPRWGSLRRFQSSRFPSRLRRRMLPPISYLLDAFGGLLSTPSMLGALAPKYANFWNHSCAPDLTQGKNEKSAPMPRQSSKASKSGPNYGWRSPSFFHLSLSTLTAQY